MKTITKEWLMENNACDPGMEWFLAQNETNTKTILLKLVDNDRANDALWVLEHMLDKTQSVQLAVFCARLCLHQFDEKFPDDSRPRKAIEAAEAYLENPCKATQDAAAYAANAAARAANAPGLAPGLAAAYAAYAAARAANAAARAPGLAAGLAAHVAGNSAASHGADAACTYKETIYKAIEIMAL